MMLWISSVEAFRHFFVVALDTFFVQKLAEKDEKWNRFSRMRSCDHLKNVKKDISQRWI